MKSRAAPAEVGILGDGQLGRMGIKALQHGIAEGRLPPVNSYTLGKEGTPCAALPGHTHVIGDITNPDDVFEFGKKLDKLFIEIERVSKEGLHRLEQIGVEVFPSSRALGNIQDKGAQKVLLRDRNLPVPKLCFVEKRSDLKHVPFPYPWVLKSRFGGYDGNGVAMITCDEDIGAAFEKVQPPYFVEEQIEIEREISVIVARRKSGETKNFPTVETTYHPGLNRVNLVLSPARISVEQDRVAQQLATIVAEVLEVYGLLAVEMFQARDGRTLVNENAPRAHNSGHASMQGNKISQFEQQWRAVLDIPLGDTSVTSCAAMANILGAKGYKGRAVFKGADGLPSNVHVEPYGKELTAEGRKMGHLTTLAADLETARTLAEHYRDLIRVETM